MLKKNYIDTSVGSHFIQDNVLHIIFKEGADVCIDCMKESKKARLLLQSNQKMKILVDSRGLFNITKEARAYAAEERHARLSIAMAIVSDSLPTRLLTNFYIKFNRPKTPTKMFTNKNKALEWLASINSGL